jgi:hypothetical protein
MPYGTPQDFRSAGGLGLINETDAWLTGRPYGLPGTVALRIGDNGRSTLIGAELGGELGVSINAETDMVFWARHPDYRDIVLARGQGLKLDPRIPGDRALIPDWLAVRNDTMRRRGIEPQDTFVGGLGDDGGVAEVLRQIVAVEQESQKSLKRIGFWTAVMGGLTVSAAVIAVGARVARHVKIRRSRTGRMSEE